MTDVEEVVKQLRDIDDGLGGWATEAADLIEQQAKEIERLQRSQPSHDEPIA